jgi:hypothetical protein
MTLDPDAVGRTTGLASASSPSAAGVWTTPPHHLEGDAGLSRLNRLRTAAAATLLVLSGCGSFQPFATPFVPRPPLPDGDPWPVPVEDIIERLEVLGYRCTFEPDSDIPGGWQCDRDGGLTAGFNSDETGPIQWGGASIFDESAPGKEAMDARAVTVFRGDLLAVVLPEAVLPSEEELLIMVQKNWPVELGNGWILGFERASNNRSLQVRYVEPEGH